MGDLGRSAEWYDPAHNCADYGAASNDTREGCRMCEGLKRRLARPTSRGQLTLVKDAAKKGQR